MPFQTFKVYLFAVLSMLFWGLSFVWFKIVVKWYEPITIIFLRLVISSFLLFAFLHLTRTWQTIKRKHIKYFLLLSFSQPFCYFLAKVLDLNMFLLRWLRLLLQQFRYLVHLLLITWSAKK